MSGLIGKVILDRYRVEEFIASGGMGAIYRVWDLKRNTSLAMKVLHNDMLEDPSIFKSFQREAIALKKLSHPNIVQFYGLFQTEEFAFILEQYVDGPSLSILLRANPGGLSLTDALVFMQAVCSALGYAHSEGVVHCDIKPANVMIDRGGQIYLADFGIARHAESTTTTFAGAGTPAYMAPEQIRAEKVFAATDVYSLGVMLFELVTGQRPFRGDELLQNNTGNTTGERIRYAHLNLTPPDPRAINPEISPALSKIILKCLSKNPLDRYSSAAELWREIYTLGVQTPDRIRLDLLLGQAIESFQDKQQSVTPSHPSVQAKPTFLQPAAIAVFLLVLALAGFAVAFLQPGKVSSQSIPLPTSVSSIITKSTPSANPINTIKPEVPSQTPTPFFPTAGDKKTSKIDGAGLVYIPVGDFEMCLTTNQVDKLSTLCEGKCTATNFTDAMPVHKVFLDSYWIYEHEITNQEYGLCVKDGDCLKPQKTYSSTRKNYFQNPDYGNYPVVFVDWYQAEKYCAWAGGELPSEAQWEKAARGVNDNRLFPWGNQAPSSSRANFGNNIGDTTSVDEYPDGASPYGVMNMSGNVYEWVADWYSADYYSKSPSQNPRGPSRSEINSSIKVVRGGNWYWDAAYSSIAFHDYWDPEKTSWDVGFRCVIPSDK